MKTSSIGGKAFPSNFEILANVKMYCHVGDGAATAYVRAGDESAPASTQQLSELARRGKNLSFDSMPTECNVSDPTFTVFNATFKREKKMDLTDKDYVSFGI